MRMTLSQDPFITNNQGKPWREQGRWPCHWIAYPDASEPPYATAYHLRFSAENAAEIIIHVSADERYELFLDGELVGRGPERGDPDNWFFESYRLALEPGEHHLAARVWTLGPLRAIAQMSVQPGFLLCAEGGWHETLSTGVAAWRCKRLPGYEFSVPQQTYWRGARISLDGRAFPWDFELGAGDGWQEAAMGEAAAGRIMDLVWHDVHRLQPATLPPMLDTPLRAGRVRCVAAVHSLDTQETPVSLADNLPDEQAAWQALLLGEDSLTIPPNSRRRVVVDMEEYYCLWPSLTVSGGQGGSIRLASAESLYLRPEAMSHEKGHRDAIDGKYFVGVGDLFLPDGGPMRRFTPHWWQAGRYWEVTVETGAESLTLHALSLRETRYPLEMESRFQASDERLEAILPMLVRGVQMSCHETYYDAPYYEELMYAGDARLEMLLPYVMTPDDRLPRKAIRMFDSSRLASGLLQSRYPSWEKQVIPPFALWWVMMLRDYAYWRDDPDYVRRFLPGMRATLEGFQRFMDGDGLLHAPEGWNFMDWLDEWPEGVPPGGANGRSGVMNWQLVWALVQAADLEASLGEPELARLWRRRAEALAQQVTAHFWDESRGLLAEDEAKRHFSEHSQALALLSGLLDETHRARVGEGLVTDPNLLLTSYYFSHYLFEAYRLLGRVDKLQERLTQWNALSELGLKTTVEKPEPTRSDCHGWSAHPLYHYFTTILGVRPGELGFRTVTIRPQLGGLAWARGALIHPLGEIGVEVRVEGDQLRARVTLPDGLTGVLHLNGRAIPLAAGETMVE